MSSSLGAAWQQPRSSRDRARAAWLATLSGPQWSSCTMACVHVSATASSALAPELTQTLMRKPELTQTLTRKPEFRKENEDSRPEDVSERAIGLHSACVVEPRCHSRNSPQVNRNIAPAVFVGPKAYERAIG